MRPLAAAACGLALLAAAPADRATGQPRPEAPRDPVEEAVDRGLSALARMQSKDGSWPSLAGSPVFPRPGLPNARADAPGDIAVTALAVMAFLSAGNVPGEGLHGDRVTAGIRYVAKSQLRNGLFAGTTQGGVEMYYHGICTLMLAEAVGMTDGRTAEELRGRLQAAVKIVLEAQRRNATADRGGWRYGVRPADLSVTGWQFLALRAAKNVGCDVPADRIEAALAYVKRCQDQATGGFRYRPAERLTEPCTGVGILCLELGGRDSHQSPEALRAAAYLAKNPVSIISPYFYYGIYYAAQAMFQVGDGHWKAYRPKLHELLLTVNGPTVEGAWGERAMGDSRYGPAYCTAMAILALTVEYRFLPIYQRFEEPLERGDD